MPRSNGVIAGSESDELPGVPRPCLLLLTVSGIEDGLSSLAGDSSSQVKCVQVELVAFVAAK
jgi:hypothetical protein